MLKDADLIDPWHQDIEGAPSFPVIHSEHRDSLHNMTFLDDKANIS